MENRARYGLIGAFVLVCILAGFGFVYWIANTGGIGARSVYTIRFEQPVSGLLPGANVLFNGVRVGAVSAIALDPAEPRRVTATVAIDPGTPVRADTQVDITFQGLTSAPAIALRGGAPDAPKLTARNGAPPLLVAGADVGKSLTESARETLRQLDEVLAENKQPLNTAVTGIAAFADMLGKNSKRVEGLIGGLESLTGAGKKEAPPVYDLAAPAAFPGLDQTLSAQVVVSEVSAVLVFDTQKILTRNANGTYAALPDAQWPDNLPRLLQARMVQSFENAHQLQAVSRPMDQLTPEYRLELSIRAFQLVPAPQPHAQVELAARLVSDKGAIPAAKIFSAEAPAKDVAPVQAVDAFNRAFGQVADAIVRWTVEAAAQTAEDAPVKNKER